MKSKNTRISRMPARTRAILTALSSVLFIVFYLLPDAETMPMIGVKFLLLIASVALLVVPMTLGANDPKDELYQQNWNKANEWTLSCAMGALILLMAVTSRFTITLNRNHLLIGVEVLLCLQNSFLAYFESRGALKGDDEEDD